MLCATLNAQLPPDLLNKLPQRLGLQANNHLLLEDGYIDVTKPPYNAVANDGMDDYTAIMNAIEDAFTARMTVYIPEGTYNVSKAFRCVMNHKGSNEGRRLYSYMITGSTKGEKPVIKLTDNSTIEDNILFLFQTYKAGKAEDPSNYSHLLRNLEIDMGNNPEVSAVSMSGAQLCSIEDVYIHGDSFNAGILDLPGSGGSSTNITVEGGDYGIIQSKFRPSPIVTGLKLTGQKKGGVIITSSRGPVVLCGFEIESPENSSTYVAVESTTGGNTAGNICLRDGTIQVKATGGTALKTIGCDVNLKNVYIQADTISELGYGNIAIAPGNINQPKKIVSYAFTTGNNKSSLNVDNQVYDGVYNAGVIDEIPTQNFLDMHSWPVMPSFEDANIINVVTDYGATPHYVDPVTHTGLWDYTSEDNDGEKIQDAIDAAALNGKTVFIPKGKYHIEKTIVVKTGVKIIGAGKINTILLQEDKNWGDNKKPIVRTEGADVIMSDLAIYGYPGCQLLLVESSNTILRDVQTETHKYVGFRFNSTVPYIDFSGDAGGKFYNLSLDHVATNDKNPSSVDYMLLRVKDTRNPVHLYCFSAEHAEGTPQVLIENSVEVYFHAFKFESKIPDYFSQPDDMYAELLHIKNSKDISIFGGSGNYFLDDDVAIIQVKGTADNVEIEGVVHKLHQPNFDPKALALYTENGVSFPQERNTLYYKSQSTLSTNDYKVQSNLSEFVYPNPVRDILNISSSFVTDGQFTQYTITDMIGNKVKFGSITNRQIDCSMLNTGVYIIQIQRADKVNKQMFIKK
jgi:hypothetical protein